MIELKQDAGGKFSASKLWDNLNMKNKFAPAILLDGFIFGLDEGILTCLDPQTGKRKWKGGHYGHGQMIYADKNLIVLGEEGQLALVKATPDKFTEIAKFDALNSKTWNVPALAGGRLLIRNDREMVCYDLRRKP
ncbi:PQQ-like beta-propeller repeat protein [Candidatus Sumerlaeota bacterium]|nr:PQQ-like beta-propeller repeat protein [Candidatus Sumerlaeota bacterium]